MTAAHPATLNKQIADIKAILPPSPALAQPVNVLLSEQDAAATEMASRLESLTAHYDQMSQALEDEESGQPLNDQEMEGGQFQVTYAFEQLLMWSSISSFHSGHEPITGHTNRIGAFSIGNRSGPVCL